MKPEKDLVLAECKEIINNSPLFGPGDFIQVAQKLTSSFPNYYELGEILVTLLNQVQKEQTQKSSDN